MHASSPPLFQIPPSSPAVRWTLEITLRAGLHTACGVLISVRPAPPSHPLSSPQDSIDVRCLFAPLFFLVFFCSTLAIGTSFLSPPPFPFPLPFLRISRYKVSPSFLTTKCARVSFALIFDLAPFLPFVSGCIRPTSFPLRWFF